VPFSDKTPLLELQADGRSYVLAAALTWRPRSPNRHRFEVVEIPEGQTTDFASVPRILWTIFPPAGRYSLAAIVHDYLCRQRPEGWTSRRAHKCFLVIMEELGVPWWRRRAMYIGVRIGGPRWT